MLTQWLFVYTTFHNKVLVILSKKIGSFSMKIINLWSFLSWSCSFDQECIYDTLSRNSLVDIHRNSRAKFTEKPPWLTIRFARLLIFLDLSFCLPTLGHPPPPPPKKPPPRRCKHSICVSGIYYVLYAKTFQFNCACLSRCFGNY